MKIVFTYKDGYKQEIVVNRPLTRALAEMYRIKYYSPLHDRGVVYKGKERIELDEYIKIQKNKESKNWTGSYSGR